MRVLIISLFISVFILAVPLTSISAEPKGQTATIQVDGLSCPFCAYGLEKNLKKVKGVERVAIDMKAGKATVFLKPETNVDNKTLRQAVKKAGFTARDITRNGLKTP